MTEPSPFEQSTIQEPAYLHHWDDFAMEQLNRPDTPIRAEEQDRFLTQCADNAAALAQAREEMHTFPTARNVKNWYGKLGSTSRLEGAKPDLVRAFSILRNSQEAASLDDNTLLMGGNVAQDIAELSRDQDAQAYFGVAVKAYDLLIRKYSPNPEKHIDLDNPILRQALFHRYDANFARLSYERRDGLIPEEEFSEKYHALQVRYVSLVKHLAEKKDGNVGNGELYEVFGEMVYRHMLWRDEQYGDAEVRRAFTPREDRPHDGFRRGGRHVNQTGALPAYAFDLKLSNLHDESDDYFIQLKADEDYGRYAQPPITLRKYTRNEPLRHYVSKAAGDMLETYKFQETAEDDTALEELMGDFSLAR